MLRARLLLSSLAPLALIVAIRTVVNHPIWAIVLALCACLAVLSLFRLVWARSTTNEQPYKVREIRDESAQIPAYLLTYLFPFLFLSVKGWQDWAAYALFTLLLVVILYRTDVVLVNPVLLAAGYHLYAVESTSGYKGILVASERPMVGQTVDAVTLTPGVLKLVSIQPEE